MTIPSLSLKRPVTNVIRGKVLTSLTGRGIPDLVVVAIDFDVHRWAEAAKAGGNAPKESGGSPQTVSDLLALLDGSARFYEAAHPQRLGSVLTGADGSFELRYEDDLFYDPPGVQPPPNQANLPAAVEDRRPDIMLLVLAPDRPQQGAAGLTIGERLLFHTQPIRFEAGRMESFVIRIDEGRLSQFHIHADENGVMLQLTPDEYTVIKTQHYKSTAAMQAARKAVFTQYELPKIQQEHDTFVRILPTLLPASAGVMQNFVGLAPSLLQLQEHLRNALRRLPWLIPGRPEHTPRTGRVYLTDADLRALVLDRGAIGRGTGQPVAFGALLDRIGYSSGPYRNRELLSQIETRRALAKLRSTEDGTTGPGPSTPAEPADSTTDALRRNVLQRLQEQVRALARPDGEANPAHDLARIKQTIDTLEQTSGVANVAAMHDVDILQVAFEPSWTAAFDEDVKQQAKDLYRELNAHEEIQASCGSAVRPIADVQNVQQLRDMLSDVIAASRAGAAPPHVRRAGQLALDLASRLAEPYSFQFFAPGSINYGMLLTYRQRWTPVTYQVGRLAETVPLAPGETRSLKVTRKLRRTLKRNTREKTNLVRMQESSSVSRTEIEAMEKTALALSNQVSAQGQFNIGIGSIGASSQFNVNQTQEAQRMHKSFAEIARKSSQEVRREVEVQFDDETQDEAISETTRTFRNPNEELTVTYLLYELERRYRVSSHIQSVQPVILVALDMPAPLEITDSWLLEHAWVLREVLLDADFEEALDLLEDNRSRDDAELAIVQANYEAAAAVHRRAEVEFERLSSQARSRRAAVVNLMQGEEVAAAGEATTEQRVAAAIFSGGLSELFGGGQSNTDDILRARREATEKALEYLETELTAAGEARDQAMVALNNASGKFSDALSEKAMTDQKLLQLRLHVRGNIFHYMHAIWRRRDGDDLFFSLYDLEVPFLEPQPEQCRVRQPTPEERDQEIPGVVIDGDLFMVDVHPAATVPDFDALPRKRLIEVADVDRPLGFKGNYVIFPLKQNSLLTDFMTVGYLDGYFGVRDPALNASYSAGDLLEYARSVWNDPVVGLTNEDRDRLAELVIRAGLRNPGYESEVVLPTGQIFMEALKGDQALLEDFKLVHRGLDVLKVEEEVREARIDNLRRAQRIGLAEPELDDPEIERTTVVRGVTTGLVLDTGE